MGKTDSTFELSFRSTPEDIQCMDNSAESMDNESQKNAKLSIDPRDECVGDGYQPENRYVICK